jgi:hypothetical protein
MRPSELSNEEVVASLESLVRDGNRIVAKTLAYLAEVEERRIHLEFACSSMFAFCTRRLGFSERRGVSAHYCIGFRDREPAAYQAFPEPPSLENSASAGTVAGTATQKTCAGDTRCCSEIHGKNSARARSTGLRAMKTHHIIATFAAFPLAVLLGITGCADESTAGGNTVGAAVSHARRTRARKR